MTASKRAIYTLAPVPFEHALPILIIDSGEWDDAARARALPLLTSGLGASRLLASSELDAGVLSSPVAGALFLGADPLALEAMERAHPRAPRVVISREPPRAAVTCWYPALPPVPSIAALFEQEPSQALPPTHRPRRKADTIVGNSQAIGQVLHACSRLAPISASVVIIGETGTGKELISRALHYSGPRRKEPFVALNCAAIPEALMEAELFGHQRGAFTGAVSARAGAFEAAGRGTLLLDEIGELPLSMQPKLLRVLDNREVTRLGSNTPTPIDCRVIAATNRDLEEEVRAGRFREDLYYRLSVHLLTLPPLRERPDDIPSIVQHHLATVAEREHTAAARLTPAAIAKLLAYAWPGNVRELLARIERALLVARGGVIDAGDISLPGEEGGRPLLLAYREAKEEFERAYFSNLMRAAEGNVTLAAALARKTRKEIYDALKRTGLRTGPRARSGTPANPLPPRG